MDEIVRDFLIESNENLDRLDQELIKLESDPSSKDLLAGIFRTIHTIKGSCGFLGFARLEKVAHAGENLLSRLRDGALSLTAEITSGLLEMVDAVRKILAEIQATEHDGDNDYAELLGRLKDLQEKDLQENAKASPPSVIAQPSADVVVTTPRQELRILEVGEPPAIPAFSPADSAAATHNSASPSQQFRPTPSKIGGVLVDRGAVEVGNLALALQEQERGDRRRLGEILVALGFCRQEDVNAAQQILESRAHQTGVETVRVGVDLLDTLMNLIGELVLARNQLLQTSNSLDNALLQSVAQRMNLIVTEVQEQVMKTRMQPIGNVWNKFPRTVRDLALNCGKEVQLEMIGQDTELDRTIIEAIKDPLTHLVRNAVDHGIEKPEARRLAAKDPSGRLTLRAFHEGGRVNIEIEDDGAGLNRERLVKKALEKELITQPQVLQMSERDIFNLIFLPGFSTAEKVTNVSGRGVGMDVVKTNVEKISGVIDIQSMEGKGTIVRVSIPLTLAIVPALIVKCGDERFAIPQVSVLELVGLDSSNSQQVELVQGAPVYRLRENLLPLVYLDRQLQIRAFGAENPAPSGSIVVLQAVGRQFGLVVDDILDTEEIVVKPLSEQFKGISAYSGATIMGDGRVALILDILGLAQAARVLAEARSASDDTLHANAAAGPSDDRQTLLLARNGTDGQVAIPLSNVTRLEGFPAHLVKKVGDREFMEYRGQVIPVVRLSQIVPPAGFVPDTNVHGVTVEVVVHSSGGHTVAVIVDCIVDIVEETPTFDSLSSRHGVAGSFMSGDNITELLDLPAIVRAAVPGLAEFSVSASAGQ